MDLMKDKNDEDLTYLTFLNAQDFGVISSYFQNVYDKYWHIKQ